MGKNIMMPATLSRRGRDHRIEPRVIRHVPIVNAATPGRESQRHPETRLAGTEQQK